MGPGRWGLRLTPSRRRRLSRACGFGPARYARLVRPRWRDLRAPIPGPTAILRQPCEHRCRHRASDWLRSSRATRPHSALAKCRAQGIRAKNSRRRTPRRELPRTRHRLVVGAPGPGFVGSGTSSRDRGELTSARPPLACHADASTASDGAPQATTLAALDGQLAAGNPSSSSTFSNW